MLGDIDCVLSHHTTELTVRKCGSTNRLFATNANAAGLLSVLRPGPREEAGSGGGPWRADPQEATRVIGEMREQFSAGVPQEFPNMQCLASQRH